MAEDFPVETAALWDGPGRPVGPGRDIATKTRNALLRGGYTTTGAVTAASAEDLRDIRHFGIGCLLETRRVLAAHGLHLAGEGGGHG